MENTTAPAYRFEVLRTYGDAYPAALFVTVAQAAAYCRQELAGYFNRTDDRAEDAPIAAGQQVRFRGPQGLRWVNGLTSPVPVGTGPALFNPGQQVYTFGVGQALTVTGRDYSGDGWYYQLRDFAGAMPERLLFASRPDPTLPAAAAAAAAPAAGPLLFSLHSSRILAGEEPGWRALPPRLFVRVQAEQEPQVVALCGSTGKRFVTHAYERGPFKLENGQQVASVGALAAYFAGQHGAMLPAEGAAMLLGTDGSIREIKPTKGKSFKLKQLYEALNCDCIDVHRPQHGPYQDWMLVFDDEGKFKERPINPLATAIWYESYPLDQYSPVDVIAGPVLLMKSHLIK